MVGGRTQDCERARAWISARLDGELSEFESTLLQGHLSDCGACSAYEAAAARVTRELRDAPLELLPHPVAVPRGRRILLQPLRVPAVAAMAVAALALGSLFAALHSRDILGGSASASITARDLAQDRHAIQRYKRSSALARVKSVAERDVRAAAARAAAQVPTLRPGAQKQ